jgi:transposase
LLALVQEAQDALPVHVQSALPSVVAQCRALPKEIKHLEKQILDWHRYDDVRQRLATVLGIGPITASTMSLVLPFSSKVGLEYSLVSGPR